MALLERDSFLQQLGSLVDEAALGRGTLVFLGGEAGVGKTALVQAFTSSLPQAVRRAAGACDPLSTPRPLGPLLDAASALGISTSEETSRSLIFQHVLASFNLEPTVVVFEDVHWADEATLDLLRFLGRRIGATKTLLVATYRDDEINLQHPLRLVLGDSATLPVQRLSLPRLSLEAVRHLADGKEVNAEELYIQTGGNPFFVTEILASDTPGLPATVRDAVLARAARVSESGRTVLEAAAVIGSRVELWLLSEVVSTDITALDECLAVGTLRPFGHDVAFRHELARQAILEAIPSHRQQVLHRLVLGALQASPAVGREIARLAHHAEAANDAEAVLEYAPAAARRAAELSAHREAVAQYARALRFAGSLPDPERAELLEEYAAECKVTGQLNHSIQARQTALEIWQRAANREKEGENLTHLAQLFVGMGRNAEAEQSSLASLEILRSLPPGPNLAFAHWHQAHLRMLNRDNAEAVQWGRKAIELAERYQDLSTLVGSFCTVGTAMLLENDEEGRSYLERGLELARKAKLDQHVANAYGNLGSVAGELYQFPLADRYFDEGLRYCIEHDIDIQYHYMLAWQALSHLYQGRWSKATEAALAITRPPNTSAISRIMALVALGRLRTRRGDPEAQIVLDEALELAAPTKTLQRLAPVRAARAEAAWSAGDRERTLEEACAAFDLAHHHKHPWFVGELAYWRWKAGDLDTPPTEAAPPFALQMSGNCLEAAEHWQALNCPYEAARALAESDDETHLKEALTTFERLGAQPLARALRHRMQTLGITGIARGPRPSTLSNPAGLTRRELEVLNLVAQGMTNTEIAERLHRSEKTIGHQVSSILAKLEVKNRTEAVRKALQRSILSSK